MITSLFVSLLAVAGFAVVLWWTGITTTARSAITTATGGVSAMLDADLSDDDKERAVRRAGLGLLAAAFGLFVRFALALAAAAVPIYAAAAIGLTSADAVLALMLRLDYIVVVSVVAVLAVEIVRRHRKATQAPAAVRYSATDQFLHNVAFSSPTVLRGTAWLEDRLVASRPAESPPIFITSLARGGTTALLNALADVPGLATHLYRDMPLVTAPLLWHRLSGGNRRQVERHERAHGDGLEIDLDTPEAFEEVAWKLGWPEKYRGDGITPWTAADRRPQAEAFLRRHMDKIVHARVSQGRTGAPGRYCSKNNANIARLGFLADTFPGCRIVVPVRRPEAHAASLLRQHRNFLELHEKDDFIRRYMRDIGHFEFGRIHRPLLFEGFDPAAHDPLTRDYWLAYWVSAFGEVLRHADTCLFVPQDDLRAAPQATVGRLCEALGVDAAGMGFEGYFLGAADVAESEGFSAELLADAGEVYGRLRAIAQGD